MKQVDTTIEMVSEVYKKTRCNLEIIRGRLNRPLTYAEKVLFGHLCKAEKEELNSGKSVLMLRPDRVAMQDATAQMAILQYLSIDKADTAVPVTVHCDHLIRAEKGAEYDLKAACKENEEVYEFLRSASEKCGIGFWGPGSGIIHQIILEHYAFPGGLIIGTDSHTPNCGGLGMMGVGVGGADAVDVMAGFAWEVKYPKIIGVYLTGKLEGWTSPKDVICYLLGLLTVKGGTNRIIEYFGPGAETISATGKATITNMGAELGATSSVFPFDRSMASYLKSTSRTELADLALKNQDILAADIEVLKEPEKYFERIIEIDLSSLEPHVTGPASPDLTRPISKLKEAVIASQWPEKVSAALIGSCTNSSYEDFRRLGEIVSQAKKLGLKLNSPLWISPGSNQIYETLKRDGVIKLLESFGAKILTNACGPCIGQWSRKDIEKGTPNSIVCSFNRNFPARNDGNPNTQCFIASPEIVLALAIAGSLYFNPLKDELDTKAGKMMSPGKVPDVPPQGFIISKKGYIEPKSKKGEVIIKRDSERLQLLKPFNKWDGEDFIELLILVKIFGKCTTDHISPAGPWLKFRGHLDKISDNLFSGAVNFYTREIGKTLNQVTGKKGEPISRVARTYKAKGMKWVAIGDSNYGEGSSREHAAMEPRYLNCAAIIAKSFARIHETNLKKQGVLPLTFVDLNDYEKIGEEDRISIIGLRELAPNKRVSAIIHHKDSSKENIFLEHSMTLEQIEWFKAGSALNWVRRKNL